MLRCAAFFVTAAYNLSTPHSSKFARLAYGAFYKTVCFLKFYEFFKLAVQNLAWADYLK